MPRSARRETSARPTCPRVQRGDPNTACPQSPRPFLDARPILEAKLDRLAEKVG